MKEIVNLDRKRVCDLSADERTVVIRKKRCVTKIRANLDGTFMVVNERINPAARSTSATRTIH